MENLAELAEERDMLLEANKSHTTEMAKLQTAVAKLSNNSQEYSLRLQSQIAESRWK